MSRMNYFVRMIAVALFVQSAVIAFADDDANPITYTKHVAPILNQHCAECHRPGEVAPMSLISYEEVRPWAKAIRTEVSERRMPPWHADPIEGVHYLEDSSMSEDEIKTVASWVDAGAPMGDPKDMPKLPEFTTDWKFGQPDMVFQMPEAYEIGAEGDDIYHCFVMPPSEKDAWMSGAEFRPDNRAVTHHVVLFLDGDGQDSVARDDAYPGPGYPCYGSPDFVPTDIIGVWAPGMTPELLPEGIARPLPAGSRIVMQMHYHRNGKAETDRSEVGVYLQKGEVNKRLYLGIALDPMLNIPPGAEGYTSRAKWTLPAAGHIMAVFPHMHVLGKTISMTARKPDGAEQPLVSVSRYDFDWQRNYFFKEPVALAAGSQVEVKAIFDNTVNNPDNPSNPPKLVRFGMGTNDEMNVGFIYLTLDEENLAATGEFPRGPAIMSMYQGGL